MLCCLLVYFHCHPTGGYGKSHGTCGPKVCSAHFTTYMKIANYMYSLAERAVAALVFWVAVPCAPLWVELATIVMVALATELPLLRVTYFPRVSWRLPTTTHVSHTVESDSPWAPRPSHQLKEMFAGARKHHFKLTTPCWPTRKLLLRSPRRPCPCS